jgi:hypothetical protein
MVLAPLDRGHLDTEDNESLVDNGDVSARDAEHQLISHIKFLDRKKFQRMPNCSESPNLCELANLA